jgi:surfactin synthase thioesterase subunit/MFS family permease
MVTTTHVPLSSEQQRLWFLHQLQPEAGDYHIAFARRLSGPLDVAALRRAMGAVTDRHDILRTRYPSLDGVPYQRVDPPDEFVLEERDLTGLPAGDREAAARRVLVDRIDAPFDLEAAAPVRWLLLRLDEREHVLCLVMHHIAGDGWSLGVLCRDLSGAYAAEPLPPLTAQYADHVGRRHSDAGDEDRHLRQLRDHLAGVAPLDLAPGHARPPARGGRGAVLRQPLSAELCRAVAATARRHRATLFMTVLAAYEATLAAHTGRPEFCVGTPISMRDDETTESLVGCFVNTLALRADLRGAASMADLLARTRTEVLSASEHATVPFDQLVRALGVSPDLSRTPLFQVMFRLDPAGDVKLNLDGLTTSPFEFGHRVAQTDLTLEVTWLAEGGWADFVYDPAVLDAGAAGAIADRFVAVLRSGSEDADRPLPLPADWSPIPTPTPAPGTAPASPVPDIPNEAGTALERALCALWAEVLQRDVVLPTDDFFDLGGHSLLAAQLVGRQRRLIGPDLRPVSVMDIFQQRTVRRIARLASGAGPTTSTGVLHELTAPIPDARRALTLVCVPYGGGSPVVYQPLADALGDTCALYALAIPGHDPGVPAEPEPLAEVARRCVEQIERDITGPVVLYGHCGVGGALAVEIALQLQAAGREPDAVYLGATYPFARPPGRVLGGLARLAGRERLRADRVTTNWLTAMGADLGGLDPDQVALIVRNIRHDGEAAEQFYSTRLTGLDGPLRCPVVSVVGEHDPVTEYAEERYKEWHALGSRAALVVLPEAGHFFLKYRATELAQILTGTHVALATGTLRAGRPDRGRWWVAGISMDAAPAEPTEVQPSLARFLGVAAGQLVSIAGSATTDFALPLWTYLRTGSLTQYAILATLAIMPGVLAAPVAGVLVDRADRRRTMLGGDLTAGAVMGGAGLLYATGDLTAGWVYALVALLSVALTVQRLAYSSAVPQLVPKRYLGHANGIVEMSNGVAQFLAPLLAVVLLAIGGLGGVLVIDVVTFAFSVSAVLAIRFPATLALHRREPLWDEMLGGVRHVMARAHLRSMVGYFAGQTIFLSALLVAINPLVLATTGLSRVAEVALSGGIGAALGGLAMTIWGGPAKRRMRAVLVATAVQGGFGVLTGLRPSVAIIAVGMAGMLFCLALVRGTYATIVHVKIPQRLQGRVFAVNQMVSWSTIPLGFAVLTPLWAHIFEPRLIAHGSLAGSLGHLVGTGPGRGLALMYVVFGLAMTLSSLILLRIGRVSRFDDEVPDTEPDDLLGLATRDAAVAAGRKEIEP